MKDLRREHYASLPEPRAETTSLVTPMANDDYLMALERYIDRLSEHVRKIQEEETRVTNKFSAFLHALHARSHEKRKAREEIGREVYLKDVARIREKRRRYREMLYDAHAERKKLVDSMQIAKDEEDILRRKLAKLNALTAPDTSREQRKNAVVDVFSIVASVLQVLFIVAFGLWFDYADTPAAACSTSLAPLASSHVFYTDVVLFVVVGMAFLMTFLRKYAFSGVGFTLLLVALAFQFTLFFSQILGAKANADGKFVIGPSELLVGLYGATTVVVSFGAVAGLLSPTQLIVMALGESFLYALNIVFGRALGVYADVVGQTPTWSAFGFGGDAAAVHVFGGVFGLVLGYVLGKRLRDARGAEDRADSYVSDVFSMFGTVLLFALWPSFNAALAPAHSQHRVVANTVLALCSSVVFAFLGSRVFRGGKFDMTDLANATLAGGIAVGGAVAMLVQPGSAMIVGAVAAIFATLTYAYVQPVTEKWGVNDTRGVAAAHVVPGLIGALSSIVAIAIAFDDGPFVYGIQLSALFPKGSRTSVLFLAALGISIGLALVGGVLVALLLRLMTKRERLVFSDEKHWRVPGDFEIADDVDALTQ